jgi:hypothetical protein
MDEQAQGLREITPYILQLEEDSDAKVGYDLFADALVWSDERPLPPLDGKDPVDVTCLRAVLHYRTSLILGRPNAKYRSAWEEAQGLFPTWPGFAPKRRESVLKDLYLQLRHQAYQALEKLESRLDRPA